jgi:hypothetical protein
MYCRRRTPPRSPRLMLRCSYERCACIGEALR